MYVEKLEIEHLKAIKKLTLDFTVGEGKKRAPRMWTVIIGRNGRAKTAILQAIALAAAGSDHVNGLAEGLANSLPRRGKDASDEMLIHATFHFGEIPKQGIKRAYPGSSSSDEAPTQLISEVRALEGKNNVTLRATSHYGSFSSNSVNPLADARAQELAYWFVAAYGTNRQLLISQDEKALANLPIKRLSYVMLNSPPLIGINFSDIFEKEDLPLAKNKDGKFTSQNTKVHLFNDLLQKIIKGGDLLPDVTDVTLAGTAGVNGTSSLAEKDRVQLEGDSFKLPAVWLSQGYQSSIAWLADLIGSFIEEVAAKKEGDLEPEHFTGLVLIDELDLFLHPTWQVKIIPALKKVFPNMQFIVTTHSPLLLSSLTPEEIVVLERDKAEGDVRERAYDPDPRMMTGSELYKEFFDLSSLMREDFKDRMRRYDFIAGDAARDDAREAEVQELRRELLERFQWEVAPPVPRGPAKISRGRRQS